MASADVNSALHFRDEPAKTSESEIGVVQWRKRVVEESLGIPRVSLGIGGNSWEFAHEFFLPHIRTSMQPG
jgi:hypothetical protein